MIKKYLFGISLFLFMCMNAQVIPSTARLSVYGIGAMVGFYAVRSAMNERIFHTMLGTGLYFGFCWAMKTHDSSKYQRYLWAEQNINQECNDFFDAVTNYLNHQNGNVNIAHLNAFVNGRLNNFERFLQQNNPEEIEKNWMWIVSSDSLLRLNPWHDFDQYNARDDGQAGYQFLKDNQVVYDPLEKRDHALAALPEPTEKYRKQLRQTKIICVGLPFACLAVKAAINLGKK